MTYDELDLKDRAAIIRIGVQNGLTSIQDIKDYWNNNFAEGGQIHIKPENRGKFTAAAKSRGMGAQEFASKVLANKDNYSSTMVKRAVFARNASHWKHNEGGYLFQEGGQEKPVQKRVDFQAMVNDRANVRYMDIPSMNQLQDSLIARGFPEAQRLALLATAEHEMGTQGAASRGIGGNGYWGLNEQRMPTSYLGNTPEKRAEQIHYIIENLINVYKGTHPQAGNWSDGGTGGPKIMSGQDGYNQFWKALDPMTATQILTKSYIRPANQASEGKIRGKSAETMKKYLKEDGGYLNIFSTGGPLYPFSFNGNIPEVRYEAGGNMNNNGIIREAPTTVERMYNYKRRLVKSALEVLPYTEVLMDMFNADQITNTGNTYNIMGKILNS